ncbi:ATPase domain of HSP90 chaperone/DNA topoisomerase II/histidine kinase, partial [Metschnikowia bicuspidata var. bicuspidata NRRL YB-4993]
MQSIHRLAPEDCKKIHSQVVIRSILDVIRELVHNSIDAGASCISIKINLESLSVCIEDNGTGISVSDMGQVGRRYYTSRASQVETSNTLPQELTNMMPPELTRSLGFKGESISSIATLCSKLVILSAVKNVVHSMVVDGENSSCLINLLLEFFMVKVPTQGSIIIVSRLFHNVPVRRKYHKEHFGKDF